MSRGFQQASSAEITLKIGLFLHSFSPEGNMSTEGAWFLPRKHDDVNQGKINHENWTVCICFVMISKFHFQQSIAAVFISCPSPALNYSLTYYVVYCDHKTLVSPIVRRDLKDVSATWDEAEELATNRAEWHQCQVQCIHLTVGWTKMLSRAVPNPAEIRLRQKSHWSRIVLPDLKSWYFPDIRYSRPRISNWFFHIKD